MMSAIVCHCAKYRPRSLAVILAPTLMQAGEDMMKIKQFIARDRRYPKLTRSGAQEIATAKGSRILVLTASDDAARGFSNPDIILFDEASRIPDDVFEAVRPMITNNPRARIYEISTPNGKKGFFYDHFSSPRWSRYLVRSPFSAVQGFNGPELISVTDEDARHPEEESEAYGRSRENPLLLFTPPLQRGRTGRRAFRNAHQEVSAGIRMRVRRR